MKLMAAWHNSKAMAAHDRGEHEVAMTRYAKAIASAPDWTVPWFNLGLLHKERRHWEESRRCNQEAVRCDPANEAAWWNLGIAATALGDWSEARRAWTAYGIELPDGDGEIRGDFGYTPIRINPRTDGEVIWTDRIDPARAIIRSVPLPESDHRHGDLLLHDGVPNGYRLVQGQEVAVFDELQILTVSSLGTFEATVVIDSTADLLVLEQIFTAAGGAAEDWSSIQLICAQCSEGRPHEHHHHEAEQSIAGERRVGIAAVSLDAARQSLHAWADESPRRSVVDVVPRLEPVLTSDRRRSAAT